VCASGGKVLQAIVKTDGRQFFLTEGQEFDVGSIPGEPGDIREFEVLMLIDGDNIVVGTPIIEGAKVRAKIEAHGKGKKLRFMKYKNKTRYRRRLGHRQHLTRLVVESIEGSS
tara:strand:- start:277 stop:615 length:339 start_codon:yes stop_codon:yes gene_type:complete